MHFSSVTGTTTTPGRWVGWWLTSRRHLLIGFGSGSTTWCVMEARRTCTPRLRGASAGSSTGASTS